MFDLKMNIARFKEALNEKTILVESESERGAEYIAKLCGEGAVSFDLALDAADSY